MISGVLVVGAICIFFYLTIVRSVTRLPHPFPSIPGQVVYCRPGQSDSVKIALHPLSVMPPIQSFLTVHGLLSAFSIRVRLTCRYLELLLDCSRHEFLIERADVQKDWACNVEALRWLAGPIYRLTAAFRDQSGVTSVALKNELRRQEGRLKAFHGLLGEVHKAYNAVDNVLQKSSDIEVVYSRHQHLQISLDFLIDVCNAWLNDISTGEDGSPVNVHEQVWGDSQFVAFWDGITSLEDVPPDFVDLNGQIHQVIRSADALRECGQADLRGELVLSLCMDTRRLLLMLIFQLLTVRPSAHEQLKAAQAAFAAAEAVTKSQQDLTSKHVRTSIELLRQRCNILVQLTNQDNADNCLRLLERTSLPELARIRAAQIMIG